MIAAEKRTEHHSPASPETVARTALAETRSHSRHQVMGLAAIFLLGMAVNLLGLPSETTGAAHVATNVFLTAHVVLAAALLASAFMVIRSAARAGSRWRRLAIWGGSAIAVTIGAGILTLSTKNNWYSYAMATGFIASLLIYGQIVVRPDVPAPHDAD